MKCYSWYFSRIEILENSMQLFSRPDPQHKNIIFHNYFPQNTAVLTPVKFFLSVITRKLGACQTFLLFYFDEKDWRASPVISSRPFFSNGVRAFKLFSFPRHWRFFNLVIWRIFSQIMIFDQCYASAISCSDNMVFRILFFLSFRLKTKHNLINLPSRNTCNRFFVIQH